MAVRNPAAEGAGDMSVIRGRPVDIDAAAVSVQSQFIPDGICYGCGPMNPAGLGLSSFQHNGVVVAEWQPQEHHAAVPGMLCGGVIGTLIDCHSGAALARLCTTRRAHGRGRSRLPGSPAPTRSR